ncbi:MAG TPA: FAD-dependent oxidoreductase [Rhodothermales bacterium]|nr:FAD-dependent oxidoreductase [Rhodothermales bacterium]
MNLSADYVIVGSGLTGATIARLLTDAGREVVVLERRDHFGGNAFDHTHESGIRVHTYGPHYFRTSSDRIWSFVNRFASFYRYEARLKSQVDGKLENWPVSADYVTRTVGSDWEPEFRGDASNFEEASLSKMPRLVYQKFVKGYTEKQWGVPAHQLSASLAGRFDVRSGDDERLVRHRYQGLPIEGYGRMMNSMLADIDVHLNADYLDHRHSITARRLLIFTGPIDELFDFDLGRLSYRGQSRDHVYLRDVDYYQEYGQINNPSPDNGAHIRTLEWKHMMPEDRRAIIKGTVITRETPITPTSPAGYEYPFPDARNQRLYERYRERAKAIPGLLVCGRLGDYRYYDMDQAIGRAMKLANRILDDGKERLRATD